MRERGFNLKFLPLEGCIEACEDRATRAYVRDFGYTMHYWHLTVY